MLDKHLQNESLTFSDPTNFKGCLERVIPCVGKTTRYAFNNIHVSSDGEKLTFVGSDSWQLAVTECESPVAIPVGEFYIPLSIAKKLSAMKSTAMSLNVTLGSVEDDGDSEEQQFDATWLERNGDDTPETKAIRTKIDVAGRFPKWQSLVPRDSKEAVVEMLATARDLVEQLTVDGKWDFVISDKVGVMTKEIPLDYRTKINGGHCDITFDINGALGWLKKQPKGCQVRIRFYGSELPIKFCCDRDTYVLMPLSKG